MLTPALGPLSVSSQYTGHTIVVMVASDKYLRAFHTPEEPEHLRIRISCSDITEYIQCIAFPYQFIAMLYKL